MEDNEHKSNESCGLTNDIPWALMENIPRHGRKFLSRFAQTIASRTIAAEHCQNCRQNTSPLVVVPRRMWREN